jgi:hypothetical protein
MSTQDELTERWTKAASKLVGRKIAGVRYTTQEEAEEYMWSSRPVVLVLDDGAYLIPLRDDEGNDGGALATSYDEPSLLPVL